MSAHRGTRTSKQNRRATKRLGKALRRMGYGYKKVTGRGQEADPKTGKVHVSKEKSFFVPGMKKRHAVALGKAFKQDYVIHGGGRRKNKTKLIHTPTKKAHATWKRTRPKAAQYDTQVGKKHFHFESWTDFRVNL